MLTALKPLWVIKILTTGILIVFIGFLNEWSKNRKLVKLAVEDARTIIVLQQENKVLQAELKASLAAIEKIKTEVAAQAERIATAQALASKNRAKSEARVQEILTAPTPDDTQELVQWAANESQRLVEALK